VARRDGRGRLRAASSAVALARVGFRIPLILLMWNRGDQAFSRGETLDSASLKDRHGGGGDLTQSSITLSHT
jgi:hypothetical protein